MHHELPRLPRAVYEYLREHADQDGTVIASRNQLADVVGVSGVSIRNAIRHLEALGVVVVSSRTDEAGRPAANLIRLTSHHAEG